MLDERERHPQRDEVVLGAVVQVAFQPASFLLHLHCRAPPVVGQLARRGIAVAAQPVGLGGQADRRQRRAEHRCERGHRPGGFRCEGADPLQLTAVLDGVL
ncbi:hypothetical protein SAMN05216215_105213 [Saccharopolyspora shandongensis]|uniref:Uncharacterized protein n=1 Tax=Saccharopolyspora shandongensis TaxID=418495 RepID=A0A1H3R7T9_9PSEU|nr:hypothetical protein [Saccharopolyspora shandongensis]SDZ21321.1 hypothetical protein SAMN05216215_105213 [Saccharopolyspora shandongensis]